MSSQPHFATRLSHLELEMKHSQDEVPTRQCLRLDALYVESAELAAVSWRSPHDCTAWTQEQMRMLTPLTIEAPGASAEMGWPIAAFQTACRPLCLTKLKQKPVSVQCTCCIETAEMLIAEATLRS